MLKLLSFSINALLSRITAKSARNIWLLIYVLGARKSKEYEKEATTTIIMLAFYCIDPVPMFLVKDHFSLRCKSHLD